MGKWSRMLRILNMLDRQEVCSEQKMIDLFGVTRRTVFRDLGALKEAGFPIEDEGG